MAIARWQPAREMVTVRDAMNRLFDESVWQPTWRNGQAYQAPMDVYADGDQFVVELSLPGYKPEEIDVQIVGRTLTVGGEAKAETPEGRRYLVRQRWAGKFERTITLPEAADTAQVTASFEHGVLRLEVPKNEAAKPRKIELANGK